jgi:hypothetical protein
MEDKMKKIVVYFLILFVATGVARADLLLSWTFSLNSTQYVNAVANSIGSGLDTGGIFNDLTRGASASASPAGTSFRTTGFRNDGINVSSNDYFQFVISAAPGQILSLTNITAAFNGTTTFMTNNSLGGVTHQWAYSTDGSSFTLIGSPVLTAVPTLPVTVSFDFSGTPALQNIGDGTDITLRYFASGQTTTGGWGFFSAGGTSPGLEVYGTVVPEPAAVSMLLFGLLGARGVIHRRKKT